MNEKKIVGIASFIIALTYANFVSAANWTPLVRIPGLPATGSVNLSMYLVGLYNFLLSIVGIVAVMMLIIGGMRYITAAGNSAAISDAKDIIQNAIFGLLLAILSWVFIATINPDVLYIKQPGSSFITTSVHGACYKDFDPGTGNCVCIDGNPPTSPPALPGPYADSTACDDACKISNCGLPDSNPCIAVGSPNDFTDPTFLNKSTYNKRCKCVDDLYVTPDWLAMALVPGVKTCNDVCQTPAWVFGGANHCNVVDFRLGSANMEEANSLPTDKDRAQKFAINDSNIWEDALEILDISCSDTFMYVNAADYTTKFDELSILKVDNGTVAPGFDGDCFAVGNMDLLNQPYDGYFGPQIILLACVVGQIYADWPTWSVDGNCKIDDGGSSVVCPIHICAEWNGDAATRTMNTKYLKLKKP